MTMTEYNRYPSRAARIAEVENLHLTRDGQPYLVLLRDQQTQGALESMLDRGDAIAARPYQGDLPTFDGDRDAARAMIAALELERDPNGY